MNPKTLDDSHYPYLPRSLIALERAAQRAREIAARTGTDLIVQRGGRIERLSPQEKPDSGLKPTSDFDGN